MKPGLAEPEQREVVARGVNETAVMRDILVAVTALPGALFFRQNVGVARTASGTMMRFGVPGCPDIIGSYHGRFVGIEVKTRTGRQSQAQKAFELALTKAGGIYIVARSPAEAISALEALN